MGKRLFLKICLMLCVFFFVNYAATVEGVVKDSSSGDPIKGAIVRLRSGNTTIARDTTGEDGRFSFTEIKDSTYTLSITMSGYNQKNMALDVEGEIVSVEVLLVKPITTTISGIVKDSISGNSLSGAVVRLRRGATTSLRDTTNQEGTFSFSNVVADSYSIVVSMEGYGDKTINIVVGNEPINLEVLLVKPVTTSLSGIVKDSSSGSPLNGAIVTLQRRNRIYRDTTNTEGNFAFSSVVADTYSLQVTMNRYNTKSIEVVVGSEPINNIEVLLVKSPTTTISGVVKDSSTGSVLSEVTLEIRSGMNSLDTVKSDNEGKFSFAEIVRGNYTIRASISGYTTKNVNVRVDSIAPINVEILLNKVVYGTILGKVTSDSLNGSPIKEARIVLSRSGAGIDTVYTDTDGNYKFENVECNVAYTLTASKDSYSNKITNLTKKVGTDTVNIYLTRLVTRTIKVIVKKASDSSAIAGANVAVQRNRSTSIVVAKCDANGIAVFENLLEGTYNITSSADGFISATISFNVSATSRDSVSHYLAIADSGTKKIVGVISDSLSNVPIEGAIVYVTVRPEGSASPLVLGSLTDNDGNYEIVGVPKEVNTVTVTAVKSSYVTSSKNLFIDTFTVSTLNIKMLPQSANIIKASSVALKNHLPSILQLSCGDIIVNKLSGRGKLRVTDLKGKVVYTAEYFRSGSLRIPLSKLQLRAQLYVIQILPVGISNNSATLSIVNIKN